jgi:hypothetical protein
MKRVGKSEVETPPNRSLEGAPLTSAVPEVSGRLTKSVSCVLGSQTVYLK